MFFEFTDVSGFIKIASIGWEAHGDKRHIKAQCPAQYLSCHRLEQLASEKPMFRTGAKL